MRLWSIHPSFLDAKGFIALWREALLAKKVLEGKTKGYKNHPQLERFKNYKDPIVAINIYLTFVFDVSKIRGYKFNKDLFEETRERRLITVTNEQIKYEFFHLLKKLKNRDKNKYKINFDYLSEFGGERIEPHPLFKIVPGRKIESWEKVK